MDLSRRGFVMGGMGLVTATPVAAQWLHPLRTVQVLHPFSNPHTGGSSSGSSSGGSSSGTYGSTLVNGYTPSPELWNGRNWRANMGSSWVLDMDHSLRLTTNKARFEIRNTGYDRSQSDDPSRRRSELSGSVYGDPTTLPNGVALWGAMSFNHHHWDDPAGMSTLFGGVHGQIHIGSTFGGSPAVAFRRNKRGGFRISTRGEYDSSGDGTNRYDGSLSFDAPHDLVYRVVLHETHGALAVWVDGRKLVDVSGVSIGTHYAQSYWNLGCYYAGGITCPVVAEYANHVYPSTLDLSSRITSPPSWPSS